MKIVGDRILVKELPEEPIAGGFEIVQGQKSPPQKGEIIETGSGKPGQKMQLEKGDIILYAKHAGTPIRIEGVSHVIMREDDAYLAL